MGVQKGYGLIFVELLDRLGTTTFQTSLMSLGTCVVGAVGGNVLYLLSIMTSQQIIYPDLVYCWTHMRTDGRMRTGTRENWDTFDNISCFRPINIFL